MAVALVGVAAGAMEGLALADLWLARPPSAREGLASADLWLARPPYAGPVGSRSMGAGSRPARVTGEPVNR